MDKKVKFAIIVLCAAAFLLAAVIGYSKRVLASNLELVTNHWIAEMYFDNAS